MIPVSSSSVQFPAQKSHMNRSWQQLFSESVLSPEQLIERLQLPPESLSDLISGNRLFQLRVPEPYLNRIIPGDITDPLLLQVMPQIAETIATSGYVTDPLQEKSNNPVPGLIHKYKSRILLITSGACAVNCRYCFRRHFDYQDNALSKERIQQVQDYIQQDTHINEVILSGGDPLATSDLRLKQLLDNLAQVPHLKRIRIHTRFPVVIPQRITDELVEILTASRLKVVWVFHINHPQEIDSLLIEATEKLVQAGMPVLNQSVLLKKVNDSANILAELSESLFDAGIQPYYLHAFDPVQGASHFNVTDEQAISIWQALQKELPGFLLPRLVREIPGRSSKTILNTDI